MLMGVVVLFTKICRLAKSQSPQILWVLRPLEKLLLQFIFCGNVQFSILSNVAQRRPVHKTGILLHKKNLFEKLTSFFLSILNHTVTPLLPTYLYTMCYFLSNCFVIIYHSKTVYVIDFDKFSNQNFTIHKGMLI